MARVKRPLERRREERRRTRLRSGKLVSLEGLFIMECQFSDLSPHGAKLRTTEPATVPERFWLFDDFYGRALLARTAWHNGREMGVELIADPTVTPLDPERLAQLAEKYYSL